MQRLDVQDELAHDWVVDKLDAVDVEQAGGHVGWVFATGAGWPVERRRRVAEIIVRHMWMSVDPDDDPEGNLLEGGQRAGHLRP